MKRQADIIIAGAGIAGICAAAVAARQGASVILLEEFPYVGGMATGGMVSPFMPHHVNGKSLVEGVFAELKEIMRRNGDMIENGFSKEGFFRAADQILDHENIFLFCSTRLTDVQTNTGQITSITVDNGKEEYSIKGKQFIDATGDGILACLANADYEISRKQQALTLFFKMSGIDFPRALDYVRENGYDFFPWSSQKYEPGKIVSVAGYFSFVKRAIKERFMSRDINYIFYCSLPEDGCASFNCVNLLGYDGSCRKDLDVAMVEGRNQAMSIVSCLVHNVPGFENARLSEFADRVGVRETRRIIGDYMVTGNDIRSCRKFYDGVVKGCYGVDIHGQKDENDVMDDIPEGDYYEIPMRALIVKGLTNCLVAGRCLSATKEGQAALRIMATCAGMGQAAGRCAAESVKIGKTIRQWTIHD